jgi:hypothetical protein
MNLLAKGKTRLSNPKMPKKAMRHPVQSPRRLCQMTDSLSAAGASHAR